MADNITVATTNDAAGAAHQKVVNEYLNATGVPTPVSVANPLPVLASMSTAGLATDTGQNTGNASLASIDTKLPSGLTVTANRLLVELPAGGSGLTNTEIRATPLPITGSVTTGGLTNSELRATPLPVSFTGGGDATAANQTTEIAKLTSIDGKVPALGQALAAASTPIVLTAAQITTLTPPAAITGFATSANQQTNAITDAQIRATPLPISGTVTANTGLSQPLTDTQIRLTPLAVSGSFFQATQPISGTVASNATLSAETTKVIGTVNVAGTIPISGALTNTELRASAVPVTSNAGTNLNTSALSLEATQASIKAKTDNIPTLGQALATGSSPVVLTAAQVTTLTPQTNALTDAQLRATAVPISGALTDAQIRATALPISGTTSVKGLAIANQTTAYLATGVGPTAGLDVSAAANITFIIKNTVAATAWTGTPVIVFEQSDDNVSWALLLVVRNDSGLSASTHTLPAGTANTSYIFDSAAEGNSFVRVRVTTGTATGGLTVVLQPGSLPFSPTVTAVLNPETTKVIGTVITSAATPATTYSSVASGVVPATAATDLVTIFGSATKTINILNIWVTGVQTTAGQAQVLCIKRSAVNAGGTSAVVTRIPCDSLDVAATATVLAYTANATTLGTAIGNVRGDRAFLPGAASASDAQGLTWSFISGKPMTLRGTAQGICINLNGATLAGGSINVTFEWNEV